MTAAPAVHVRLPAAATTHTSLGRTSRGAFIARVTVAGMSIESDSAAALEELADAAMRAAAYLRAAEAPADEKEGGEDAVKHKARSP